MHTYQDIYILPVGCDILLPTNPEGNEKVNCKICDEYVEVHELVNHNDEQVYLYSLMLFQNLDIY